MITNWCLTYPQLISKITYAGMLNPTKSNQIAYPSTSGIFSFSSSFILLLLLLFLLALHTHLFLCFNLVFGHKLCQVCHVFISLWQKECQALVFFLINQLSVSFFIFRLQTHHQHHQQQTSFPYPLWNSKTTISQCWSQGHIVWHEAQGQGLHPQDQGQRLEP